MNLNTPLARAKARIAAGPLPTLTPDDLFESTYVCPVNAEQWGKNITQTFLAMQKIAAEIRKLDPAIDVAVWHPTQHLPRGYSAPQVCAPTLAINGRSVFTYYNWDFERTGSSWRRSMTDKMYWTTGDYGSKTRYPQKKDGTHSYDKIAADIYRLWDTARQCAIADAARKAAAEANKAAIEDLITKYKLSTYESSYTSSITSANVVGKVRLTLREKLTPEQAEQVLALLASFKEQQ